MKALTLSIAAALLLVAPAAQAAECVGVSFPDKKTVEGNELVLNGLGLREATAFKVDVYVGALYVPQKTKDASAIVNSDDVRQIDMHFVRNVSKKDMAEAWAEGYENNVPGANKTFAAEIKKIQGLAQDLKKGDTMTFTSLPDNKGLRVEIKGEEKGVIENPAFADATFALYLGKQPPNQGLKDGLLGGECD